MIVERSKSSDWLSNTYLVADKPGGTAVLIDTGGPTDPILEKIGELGVAVTHALCTHHHVDHVAHNEFFRRRLGCLVGAHSRESHLFEHVDMALGDGEEIKAGELSIRCLHIPGHTLGQVAFLVNEECVFTGDTLFKSSVGGTRGPGHTTYEEIKHSIMEVLMRLPKETAVYPGHGDSTTIGREWERNPFIRLWRGLDEPAGRRCKALGRPATLLLRAADYDGGTKCHVRFDGGTDDIVPGSMVQDSPA